MKLAFAFFRLIRWPNLVFIALTQFLFWYFVMPYAATMHSDMPSTLLTTRLFLLLMSASVFIAAAGYIINDYFDVNIDQVNKLDKVILGTIIKRRYAIVIHLLLSFAGLLISFYIGQQIENYYLPFFNLIAIVLLVFYSTTLKKTLLVGNVFISLLTAWVILVLTLCEYRFDGSTQISYMGSLFQLTFIYSGFAFIISLCREVVKDMEDIKGDQRFNCTTMPIVWGFPVSKMFVAVWMSVVIFFVCYLSGYLFYWGKMLLPIYSIILIAIPAFYIVLRLYKAKSPTEFHRISTLVKLVMLTGIISMIILNW